MQKNSFSRSNKRHFFIFTGQIDQSQRFLQTVTIASINIFSGSDGKQELCFLIGLFDTTEGANLQFFFVSATLEMISMKVKMLIKKCQ